MVGVLIMGKGNREINGKNTTKRSESGHSVGFSRSNWLLLVVKVELHFPVVPLLLTLSTALT